MSFTRKALNASVGTALAAMLSVASAQTVRIANQGDALSLDPHSLNESLQLSTVGNVYEPLVDENDIVDGITWAKGFDLATGRPIACQYGPMPRPNAMANRPSVMACIVDPMVAVTVGCRVW